MKPRFTVSMDPEAFKALQALALEEDRSVSGLAASLLRNHPKVASRVPAEDQPEASRTPGRANDRARRRAAQAQP